MGYSKGQIVIVQKVAGIRGRKAKITDVIKTKNKPTIYKLNVQGFQYPYHCTSAYIKLAKPVGGKG